MKISKMLEPPRVFLCAQRPLIKSCQQKAGPSPKKQNVPPAHFVFLGWGHDLKQLKSKFQMLPLSLKTEAC